MWSKNNIEMTNIFEFIFKIEHNFLEFIKNEKSDSVWSFKLAENLKTILLYFGLESNKF